MSSQIPELPYNGTSGWSGTDTSRQRAITQDQDGTTANNQSKALLELLLSGQRGLTVAELREMPGFHHGSASGVLSVLHQSQRIARLNQKRGRCKIYILHEFVDGRKTEIQKAKKCCPHCGGNL